MKIDSKDINDRIKRGIGGLAIFLLAVIFLSFYFSTINPPLLSGGVKSYKTDDVEYYDHRSEETLKTQEVFMDDFPVYFFFEGLNVSKKYGIFVRNDDLSENFLTCYVFIYNDTSFIFVKNIDFDGGLVLVTFNQSTLFLILSVNWES